MPQQTLEYLPSMSEKLSQVDSHLNLHALITIFAPVLLTQARFFPSEIRHLRGCNYYLESEIWRGLWPLKSLAILPHHEFPPSYESQMISCRLPRPILTLSI